MFRNLHGKFNALQKAHPTLAGGLASPSMGNWGLVADHGDGTVSKFLFRKDTPLEQGWAEENLRNELAFLRLMNGSPIDNVKIPALIEDVTPIEGGDYFAHYRMTKLSGTAVHWVRPSTLRAAGHFDEAGRLLAQFHAVVKGLNVSTLIDHGNKGTIIETLPELSDDHNKALERANDHLQQHRIQPGVIHGDYHGGNILLNGRGRISGLIDFAVSGPAPNLIVDTLSLPESRMSDFRNGYAKASGREIDPDMSTMTAISLRTHLISHFRNDPVTQTGHILELETELKKCAHITGFRP